MMTLRIRHTTGVTHENRAVVLLFTLIVMTLVSSVVGAYLCFVQVGTTSTAAQISHGQALHLAEAGIHFGVYSLTQNSAWTGTGSPETLGEGTFSVNVTTLDANEFRLISTGTVDGLPRTVQQDLSAALAPKINTWQEIE